MLWLWVGFLLFISVAVALDLGVFHKRGHVIGTAEGVMWTAIWVVLALIFNGAVYVIYDRHLLGAGTGADALSGTDAALEFFTGYIIEKSLSLDNIFVIALIFSYFQVPAKSQHRVLMLGVLGALIMRGVMIGLGVALIRTFSWTNYLLGGILLVTAARMLVARHDAVQHEKNPLVRLARRFLPITDHFHGDAFTVRENGRRVATPLLVVLLVVESTDVLFAVDSIPAIFAVTSEPFIVFTSNVFAVLGLRSLYFVLVGVMERFFYLKYSLVLVLAFVGVKMLVAHHWPIPTPISLAIIAAFMAAGVLASILIDRRKAAPAKTEAAAMPRRKAHAATWAALFVATAALVALAVVFLHEHLWWVLLAGIGLMGLEAMWVRQAISRSRRPSA